MSNSIGNLGSQINPAFNRAQEQIEKLEARLDSERSSSLEEIKEFEEIGRKNQAFLEELKVLEDTASGSAYAYNESGYEDRGMVLRDQVLGAKLDKPIKSSFKENVSYYQKQLTELLSGLE